VGQKLREATKNCMLKELLAGSQTRQRPVAFPTAEQGSAGGLADTKTGEDAPRYNVINLF